MRWVYLLLLWGLSAGARPLPLRVGVTTSTNDMRVLAKASAIADWVKHVAGRESRAEVFEDYDALANALAAEKLDVAWMGPLTFLRAEAQAKVEPLARAVRHGRASYRAVLVVREDSVLSNLDSLAQAKNLKMGWVDPSSASGYVFPRHLLLEKKIDPAQVFLEQDFAGSHAAVCKGVAEGKWEVGATFTDEPEEQAEPPPTGCMEVLGKDAPKLKIIATTRDIPADALVARATLEVSLKRKLREAALELSKSKGGAAVLRKVFVADGFEPVASVDYDAVRGALEAFKK